MSGGRRRALLVALAVAAAHLALTALALRALVTGTSGTQGPPAWSALTVALLGFPLFYTPLRAAAGPVPAGLLVAVLNSLLWGALVLALLRWSARRR